MMQYSIIYRVYFLTPIHISKCMSMKSVKESPEFFECIYKKRLYNTLWLMECAGLNRRKLRSSFLFDMRHTRYNIPTNTGSKVKITTTLGRVTSFHTLSFCRILSYSLFYHVIHISKCSRVGWRFLYSVHRKKEFGGKVLLLQY